MLKLGKKTRNDYRGHLPSVLSGQKASAAKGRRCKSEEEEEEEVEEDEEK